MKAEAALRGKISVIAGEGFGTGAAVARLFREHGAKVAMMGSDGKVLEAAVPRGCPDSLGYLGDTGAIADLEDFHRQASARFGRPDILVINAGGPDPIQWRPGGRVPDLSAKDAFHAVKSGLPFLSDGASIVLTTPCLANAGALGDSMLAAYMRSMRFFVRVFCGECSRSGIRVNAVAPSRTAMAAACGQAGTLLSDQVLDVARTVLFLASDESRSITGGEIRADRLAELAEGVRRGRVPPRPG